MSRSDEDTTLLTEVSAPSAPSTRRLGGLAAVVGAFALVACIAIAAPSLAPHEAVQTGTSPRALLEDPEVVNALTDQVMEIRKQNRQAVDFQQWKKTHTAMRAELHRQNAQLAERRPDVAKTMDSISLTSEEKDGLLHVMRHFGDRRLRSLGRDVKVALRESAHMDKAARSQYVRDKLQTRRGDARDLQKEMFDGLPASLGYLREGDWDGLMNSKAGRRLQDPADVAAAAAAQAQVAAATIPTIPPLPATAATIPQNAWTMALQAAPVTTGMPGLAPTALPAAQVGYLYTTTLAPDVMFAAGVAEAAQNAEQMAQMAEMAANMLPQDLKNDPTVQAGLKAFGPAAKMVGCLAKVYQESADNLGAADMSKAEACEEDVGATGMAAMETFADAVSVAAGVETTTLPLR